MNHAETSDGRRSRHADRRPQLLDLAADYVLEHGLRDLSVRPLANALGLSHRTLLYHFGSKEELVAEVVGTIRDRDRGQIARYLAAAGPGGGVGVLRAAWSYFTAPERTAYVRLYHEALALGLRGGDSKDESWLDRMVAGRIRVIAAALKARGCPDERAEAVATLVVASVRGLQLHLLATEDRDATNAAFDELLNALVSQFPGLSEDADVR